jgi:5-methyltetrahydropteroyltriglutamate--homocysteine methyltransferase
MSEHFECCRAETIGSMFRPTSLTRANEALRQGRISAAEFKRTEDRAVDHVIAIQEGAGLDVITDGEMRRMNYMGSLAESVSGIAPAPGNFMPWRKLDGTPADWELPVSIVGRLARTRSKVTEEYAYARAVARVPVKVTFPSPMLLLSFWHPDVSSVPYPDVWEAVTDGAAILREDVLELASLGCTYVQIDAPDYGCLVDPRYCEWSESRGLTTEQMLSDGLDLINQTFGGVPGVKVGMHLCKGNNSAMMLAEGGYDDIARELFSRATAVDTFLLEYDDERSGSFEALSDLPADKQVVLGLVSTKRASLERRDDLLARIDEAQRHVPVERLGISTQCGFASGAEDDRFDERVQAAKLELVAEVAQEVWGAA